MAESSLQLRDYWDYQDYLNFYPEQARLTAEMATRVYAEPKPINVEQDKPIQIDVVYPGAQLSDYWWRNLKALELRLQELGIDYELNQFSMRPNLDHREESRSLQQVLKNESDYLIFTLDTSQHRKFAYRVLNEGKTKLILLNITTPIKSWEKQHPMMYVGFDHVIGTKMLASHVQTQYPDSADYADVLLPRLCQRGEG
ncbi:autoinducer 2-binding periplasmic protein luxP precursor [Vibrio sp. JCM 19236]|nr:autoinducer 2-binding periplasmic protein luxP precursor [Vibrio sp. JCM 19236]